MGYGIARPHWRKGLHVLSGQCVDWLCFLAVNLHRLGGCPQRQLGPPQLKLGLHSQGCIERWIVGDEVSDSALYGLLARTGAGLHRILKPVTPMGDHWRVTHARLAIGLDRCGLVNHAGVVEQQSTDHGSVSVTAAARAVRIGHAEARHPLTPRRFTSTTATKSSTITVRAFGRGATIPSAVSMRNWVSSMCASDPGALGCWRKVLHAG